MIASLRPWLSLVRFGHSVFALPFALISAWLAAQGMPSARVLVLVVVCAVAARTAALGFNRLVDRDIDAQNPRTLDRELVRGVLSPGAVRALVVGSASLFVAAAFGLNPLSGWLSLPVLVLLFAYSWTKRFSWWSHAFLGLALALAPLGAWVAVTGRIGPDLPIPLLLAGAVLCWVSGFDLIYACQDAEFDRARGLHSVPARFGIARALWASSACHVATVILLALFARAAGLGACFWAALALASVLLVWQHRIVSPRDLSRVDLAFFTLNGWVGVGLFAGTALDLARS
jgi:4-hydroxybenzoate polyprenyltransferase